MSCFILLLRFVIWNAIILSKIFSLFFSSRNRFCAHRRGFAILRGAEAVFMSIAAEICGKHFRFSEHRNERTDRDCSSSVPKVLIAVSVPTLFHFLNS